MGECAGAEPGSRSAGHDPLGGSTAQSPTSEMGSACQKLASAAPKESARLGGHGGPQAPPVVCVQTKDLGFSGGGDLVHTGYLCGSNNGVSRAPPHDASVRENIQPVLLQDCRARV